METLKGLDKFRQVLKKLYQPTPSSNVESNHDTSIIRKSSRATKKLIKYDASPYVPKAKGFKSKNESIRQKKMEKRRDIAGGPSGRSDEDNNKSRVHATDPDYDVPVEASFRGKKQDLRKNSGEQRGRSGEKNKSRERTTYVGSDSPVAGSSRDKQQAFREELVPHGSSSPQRSAFRKFASKNNPLPSNFRRIIEEPTSELKSWRNQECESSYMPDHRRQRDFESSFMRERRQQDYEPSYVVEAGRFSEGARFSKFSSGNNPLPSNFRRIIQEPTSQLKSWGNQEYERSYMPDHRSQRESSFMRERRHQDYEPSYVAEKRMVDLNYEAHDVFAKPNPVLSNQSRCRPNASQNYNIYGTTNNPRSDNPKRFEGSFLRPPTPPGLADLVQKEQSSFLDTLTRFKNCTIYSTVEKLFHLNHWENSLIHKMSKIINNTELARSARMTMMEVTSEDSLKRSMVQSWLKSNDLIAPQRWVNGASKRRLETTDDLLTKKMKMTAEDDNYDTDEGATPFNVQVTVERNKRYNPQKPYF